MIILENVCVAQIIVNVFFFNICIIKPNIIDVDIFAQKVKCFVFVEKKYPSFQT